MLHFVADVHMDNHRRFGGPINSGLNTRALLIAASLENVAEVQEELGGDLFILGDLFNTSTPWPQLVRAVRDALVDHPHMRHDPSARRIWAIPGNHDQRSTDEGDHALASMEAVTTLELATTLVVARSTVQILLVPFEPGAAIEYIARAVRVASEQAKPSTVKWRILAFHAGIRDEETPWFLREAVDAVDLEPLLDLCEEHGFTHVFAGNWHNHKIWRRRGIQVVQVGSLCPTGFGDPGHEHGMVTLDAETGELELTIIDGPRFLQAKTLSEVSSFVDEMTQGSTLFLEWNGPEVDAPAARSAVDLLAAETIGGFSVVAVEHVEATDAARSAVQAVQGSPLSEMLAGWIEGATFPEGVPKDAVLAASRRFLGC